MPQPSLSERIEFYGFDSVDDAAFKRVSVALDRAIEPALDGFYSVISSRPELANHFDGSQSMGRAKNLQAEHWRAVFSDGVGDRFYDRAMKIGNVHAHIGLELKWYVGAYALVLDQIIMEIIAPGWQRMLPWKRSQAKAITALIKVSLLDIDLALSAYFADIEESRMKVSDSLGSALESVAAGNLTVSLADFPADYRKIESDFNSAFGSICETVSAVVMGVDSIKTGSSEIRTASNDLARRTEEQAANLEETAAAVSQTTERVAATAETTTNARDTIQKANAMAKDGSKIVSEAVTAMDQIEKSSEEINSIISVIDSIAFQTNLLALNAGVEAARAGETGKGFAVVASEVRALAQRCTEAADEVKALISASGQHVSAGVELVKSSGEAFSAITSGVSELSEALETISDSTNIQAESLSQINGVVSELDRSTQQNAAMAEQCTAAATNLAQEADRLGQTVSAFEIGAADGSGAGRRREGYSLAA